MFLYYTFVLSLYNTCFGFSVIGYFYNSSISYKFWTALKIEFLKTTLYNMVKDSGGEINGKKLYR